MQPSEYRNKIKIIANKADQIITLIEQDPADINRARKFLNVYLSGARKVIEKYANTKNAHKNTNISNHFGEILSQIDSTFEQQIEYLNQDNLFDLDVDIEVLKLQLK